MSGVTAVQNQAIALAAAARVMQVGAAGQAAYTESPLAIVLLDAARRDLTHSGIPEVKIFDPALISTKAPRSFTDFVRTFASPDGELGIKHYISADDFTALASAWDQPELRGALTRMTHSFWVYMGLMKVKLETAEAFQRFEVFNPGRGKGTVLAELALQTHNAWLGGEKKESYYVSYSQALHDFITECIQAGVVTGITLDVHKNPKKKYRLKADEFQFASEEQRTAFESKFKVITGRDFNSGFVINTVCGEWDVLSDIQESGNPDWSSVRPSFLFGLQADSVAAILKGLENPTLLQSLSEGSIDERFQSALEIMRMVNVAWRVNNPWGGINSPLLGKPFALKEDGGIGIEDIQKDGRTLVGVLTTLERARKEGRVTLDSPIADGLRLIFERLDVNELLALIEDKAYITEAVRENTKIYRAANHG